MEFVTLKGTNLNTTVYRGFAPIKDVAAISASDRFNQDKNPEGLQRDLTARHAAESYRYAEGSREVPDHPRLWPEVILNIRDTEVVTITPIDESHNLWKIIVHEDLLDKSLTRPNISRTDGNHRLNYGDGHDTDWPPLDVPTPFCFTVGLTPEKEAFLFIDINDNQKAMNTSHLAHLKTRLTESESLAIEDPALWIAQHLVDDPESPFHGIIYLGGEKSQGLARKVNLAALRTASDMLLKESVKLRAFVEIEPKYAMSRIYWNAVSKTYSREWGDSRQYLLLRGFGIWCMAILGGEIIDRCVARRVASDQMEDEMIAYLRQTRMVVDWDAKEGTARGHGGRVGARNLAEMMKRALSDDEVDIGHLAQDLTRSL